MPFFSHPHIRRTTPRSFWDVPVDALPSIRYSCTDLAARLSHLQANDLRAAQQFGFQRCNRASALFFFCLIQAFRTRRAWRNGFLIARARSPDAAGPALNARLSLTDRSQSSRLKAEQPQNLGKRLTVSALHARASGLPGSLASRVLGR